MLHVCAGEYVGPLALLDAVAQQARGAECQYHGVAGFAFERARNVGEGRAQAAGREYCDFSRIRHCGEGAEHEGGEPASRTHDSVPAFGKNNCSPPILYAAIVSWPLREISQSTNCWPRSRLTFGCLAGLTSI